MDDETKNSEKNNNEKEWVIIMPSIAELKLRIARLKKLNKLIKIVLKRGQN